MRSPQHGSLPASSAASWPWKRLEHHSSALQTHIMGLPLSRTFLNSLGTHLGHFIACRNSMPCSVLPGHGMQKQGQCRSTTNKQGQGMQKQGQGMQQQGQGRACSPLLRPAARLALTVVRLCNASMTSFRAGAALPSSFPLACKNLSTACRNNTNSDVFGVTANSIHSGSDNMTASLWPVNTCPLPVVNNTTNDAPGFSKSQ